MERNEPSISKTAIEVKAEIDFTGELPTYRFAVQVNDPAYHSAHKIADAVEHAVLESHRKIRGLV